MLPIAIRAVTYQESPLEFVGDGWRLDVTREADGSVTANLQDGKQFLASNGGAGAGPMAVANMLVDVVDSFIARHE